MPRQVKTHDAQILSSLEEGLCPGNEIQMIDPKCLAIPPLNGRIRSPVHALGLWRQVVGHGGTSAQAHLDAARLLQCPAIGLFPLARIHQSQALPACEPCPMRIEVEPCRPLSSQRAGKPPAHPAKMGLSRIELDSVILIAEVSIRSDNGI